MTYSVLLIDFDHTLFDSDSSEQEAFTYTLRRCGVSSPTEYFETYRTINRNLWESVEQGQIRPHQVRTARFARLADTIGLDANPETMAQNFAHSMGANGALYPGARQLLEQLSTRTALALVSNALSEIQRARIERLNIGQLFDTIVISSEVGVAKPNHAIFDITFERLGNPDKKDTVIIGDSLTADIEGGAGYGIATCWYNPHNAPTGPHAPPTHQITNLGEVTSLTSHAP